MAGLPPARHEPHDASTHRLTIGVLAGLAAGALWGGVFVIPRVLPVGPGAYSSVDLTAGRFAMYGLMAATLIGIGRWRSRATAHRLSTRYLCAALLMSVLGFTGYYLMLALSVRDAGSEVPSLVIGTIPIWIMLLGKPKGLRWSALVPGIALTLAGLVLMTVAVQGAHGDARDTTGHFQRGIGLVLGALVAWTIYGLMNAAWLQRHPEIDATDWANALGVATGLGAVVLWAVAGSNVRVLAARDDFALFVSLSAFAGLGAGWLATVLWNVASQRLSASLCGQLIVSETIFALAYSFGWDRRWPGWAEATACVLFTLGIVASARAHR